MDFVPELFFKKTKFMCKTERFQSLGMKNELHVKFRDENNNLAFVLKSNNIYHAKSFFFFWISKW